jgi:septal ring factor EnvC (AmiA/AmiB activator)
MFGFLSNKLLMIGAGAFVILAVGFGLYFKHTQSQLQILAANVAKAEMAIDLQKQAIKQLENFAQEQKISNEMMQGRMSRAEADRAQLAKAIKDLNIVGSAQTDRKQLQINLNNQLNELFNSAVESSKNAPSKP